MWIIFLLSGNTSFEIILKTGRHDKWERNDTHAEYLVSVYISIVDSFSPDSLPQDFTQSRSYVHSPENETTSVEVPAIEAHRIEAEILDRRLFRSLRAEAHKVVREILPLNSSSHYV